jgi:hypothetical protein
VTDRYTTAVAQISTPDPGHLETRLGGIYGLERLAVDSPRDQPTIIEVLSAFIRTNAPTPAKGSGACPDRPVALDVQAALIVLGRRDPVHDSTAQIDVSNTCLNGADLYGANLVNAHLNGANLNGANLNGAFLTNANLFGVDLDGTVGTPAVGPGG